MIFSQARTLTYALILSLTLAFLGWGLSAPSAQGQRLAQVYMFTPEQGAEPGLEAAMRQHANWREENGDPWEWNVYQVVQGKNYGTYVVRSPNHSWADFDEYSEGFGPKGAQHFNATVAPMAASTSSYIAERDSSVTHLPEDMSEYALFEVNSYQPKPGHGQEFYEAHEKLFQAVTERVEESYIETIDVIVGAEDDYIRMVFPHTSWADFEEPDREEDPVEAAYGEETARELRDQLDNSVRSFYNMVARYRPDLSVEPQQ